MDVNDFKRIVEFFNSLNLKFKEFHYKRGQILGSNHYYAKIILANQFGYNDYCAKFYFNNEGKFLTHEC